jgi:hypothetical protein
MSDTDRDSFLQTQARHVRQCWFEAKVVGLVWLTALVYCSCMLSRGYVAPTQRPELPALVWGVPAWVFWGLLLPWVVLIGVTWLFAAFVLKDDEPYQDFPGSARPKS